MNYSGPAQEVWGNNNTNWDEDHYCDILAAFCPCPKNLPEVKNFK